MGPAESVVAVLRPYQFRGKMRLLNRLAPAAGERTARIFGARMQLDLADWIQRNIYLGTYERHETRIFRKLLERGDVVLDIGANVGYFTALAASRVGSSGRVLAFEPSPYAFTRLLAMIRSNDLRQCQAFNLGLSDDEGELPMYLDPSYGNYTPTMVAHGGGAQEIARVPVRRLDDVLKEAHVDRVALMKIDVEGHEPAVLAGARESLHSGRIRRILIELNDHWLRRSGSSSRQLLNDLRAAEFHEAAPVDLPPDEAEDLPVQNVLFTRA